MRTASKQPLPHPLPGRATGRGDRLVLGLAAGLLAWIAGVGQPATPIQAQSGANQAGIVVRHGDGRVVTACVAFDEPQITGIQLLQRSGLDLNVEASSTGAGVCRLDGEGCSVPQQSCFCQCTGATCSYWSYWQLRTDGWQYSNFGASGSEIKPGQVDGWAWGAGSMDSTNGKPPALTFADVCAASTPTGTPTVAPATATPASTSTPTGTPTPFPTAVPLGSPPRIETFAADATQLAPGQVATLHWRVVDAASVMLVAGGQRVPVGAEGTTTVAPAGDVEVRLEASNNSGTAAGSVQLQVIQPLAAAAQAAPGPVLAPTPLPVPPTVLPAALVAAPEAATLGIVPVPPVSALSVPAPATAAAPQAPPASQLTARLMLPLVLRDTAQAAAGPSSAAENGGSHPGGAASPVPTERVPTPAAAIVVATPTVVPAAVLPAALPTAALAAETDGAAAAADPSQAQIQATNRLLWTALAALLILPAGLGLLGYLAWRFVSRR